MVWFSLRRRRPPKAGRSRTVLLQAQPTALLISDCVTQTPQTRACASATRAAAFLVHRIPSVSQPNSYEFPPQTESRWRYRRRIAPYARSDRSTLRHQCTSPLRVVTSDLGLTLPFRPYHCGPFTNGPGFCG